MENSSISPTWQHLYPAIKRIQGLREALSNNDPTSEYNFHKLEYGLNQSIVYSLASLVEGFLTYRYKSFVIFLKESDEKKYRNVIFTLCSKKILMEDLSKISWNTRDNNYKDWFKVLFDNPLPELLSNPDKDYEYLPNLFSLRNFLIHGQLIEFIIPEEYFDKDNKNSEIEYERKYKDLFTFHEKILNENFEEDVYFIDRLVNSKVVDLYVKKIMKVLQIIEDFINEQYPPMPWMGESVPYSQRPSIKDILNPSRWYDDLIIKVENE